MTTRTASLCQISTKPLQLRPTYGDFFIFQDGGCRHLGFLKLQIFNGRNGQEGQTASLRQISSKSLEPRPRYVSYFNIMLVRLKTADSRPLGGWAHFPKLCYSLPNPQKDRPWAELRHLSHKPRKLVARFELGVCARTNRTGQDRKKVTKGLYIHQFVKKPPLKRCT